MLELGRRLDFGQEPFGTNDGSQFGLKHLQRDLAFVLEVVCHVDGGHPALAQFWLNGLAAF